MKVSENTKKPFFVKNSQKIEKKPYVSSKSVVKSKDVTAVAAPVTLEEYFKIQEKHAAKEANNEKEKICMAAKDELFPDFLTKLGLITKMIDDVTQFRIRLKRSRSRMNDKSGTSGKGSFDEKRRKKKTNDNVGLSVEATEAIWKMKKKSKLEEKLDWDPYTELSSYKKPIMMYKSKNNKLGSKLGYSSRRRSNDKSKVPACFGYQYFYAVDAMDDHGSPDIEVFQEYFSDLSDDKLALQLSDIIQDCSEPILSNQTFTCPEVRSDLSNWGSLKSEISDEFSIPKSCQEACLIDSDCAEDEMCCTNSCGGHTCYKSVFSGKTRKGSPNRKSRSVCQESDEIIKCLYNKIKKRVCAQ